jgi:hypothetical protein
MYLACSYLYISCVLNDFSYYMRVLRHRAPHITSSLGHLADVPASDVSEMRDASDVRVFDLRHRQVSGTSGGGGGGGGGSRSGGGSKYSDIKDGQNFGRTIVSERGRQYCVEQSVGVAVYPHSSVPFKTLSRSSSSTSMLRDTALLKNMAEVDRLKAAIHALRGDPLRGAEKEKGVAGASVHSASGHGGYLSLAPVAER